MTSTEPNFSPQAYDVTVRLGSVPTLSELCARLGALPDDVLRAVIATEPALYATMKPDLRDTATYLSELADHLSRTADRLDGAA